MMLHNGKLLLETSNSANGNFKATAFGAQSKRYKLELKHGVNKQVFDVRSDGVYELFPLQFGDGKYDVTLYENVRGNTYSKASAITFNVKLKRPDASQLVPNQYVNYNWASPVIQKADALCTTFGDEEETYRAICNYVKQNFRYDYVKAVLTKPGTLPDVEKTFQKKMGICQDLAAVTVAMLRSQGIPSKLVIGNLGKQYHAWVTATVNGEEKFFDPTAEIGKKRLSKNYTVERWY